MLQSTKTIIGLFTAINIIALMAILIQPSDFNFLVSFFTNMLFIGGVMFALDRDLKIKHGEGFVRENKEIVW